MAAVLVEMLILHLLVASEVSASLLSGGALFQAMSMVSIILFGLSVIAGPKIQNYTNIQGQMIINEVGGWKGNQPKCLVY